MSKHEKVQTGMHDASEVDTEVIRIYAFPGLPLISTDEGKMWGHQLHRILDHFWKMFTLPFGTAAFSCVWIATCVLMDINCSVTFYETLNLLLLGLHCHPLERWINWSPCCNSKMRLCSSIEKPLWYFAKLWLLFLQWKVLWLRNPIKRPGELFL